MTLLVLSEANRSEYASVALSLMREDRLGAEQTGFVEKSEIADSRLQMMGGEFCGNATASLAAYISAKTGKTDISLEVSGSDTIVPCNVVKDEEIYRVTVSMPLPLDIYDTRFPELCESSVTVVKLPGITHIVANTNCSAPSRETLARICKKLDEPAIGVIILDEEKMSIHPVIYVADTNEVVHEKGCGSGSAATGAYMARKLSQTLSTDVIQEGGIIHVNAEMNSDNAFTSLKITVPVFICAEGKAYL